jgi:hypothetical protein
MATDACGMELVMYTVPYRLAEYVINVAIGTTRLCHDVIYTLIVTLARSAINFTLCRVTY